MASRTNHYHHSWIAYVLCIGMLMATEYTFANTPPTPPLGRNHHRRHQEQPQECDPSLEHQCTEPTVASTAATAAASTNTWFGRPVQRRYVPATPSSSTKRLSNQMMIQRGGSDDHEEESDNATATITKTIQTPTSIADVEALLIKAGSQQQLVVIDFTASWCGPCQTIAPKFQEMSEQMPNVMFVKIDVDECADVAAKYNVSAMPTFIFIKNGEIIDRLMGANIEKLHELIQEYQ